MAKKDKKSKTVEQKARVASKQNKKAAQKEKKVKSKGSNEDSDADDVDLESILEEYVKQVRAISSKTLLGRMGSAMQYSKRRVFILTVRGKGAYVVNSDPPAASAISQSHRNSLRAAFPTLFLDFDWITVQ